MNRVKNVFLKVISNTANVKRRMRGKIDKKLIRISLTLLAFLVLLVSYPYLLNWKFSRAGIPEIKKSDEAGYSYEFTANSYKLLMGEEEGNPNFVIRQGGRVLDITVENEVSNNTTTIVSEEVTPTLAPTLVISPTPTPLPTIIPTESPLLRQDFEGQASPTPEASSNKTSDLLSVVSSRLVKTVSAQEKITLVNTFSESYVEYQDDGLAINPSLEKVSLDFDINTKYEIPVLKIEPQGLTPNQNSEIISFRTKTGREIYSISNAQIEDLDEESTTVEMILEDSSPNDPLINGDSAFNIVFYVDENWLDASEREYPLKITLDLNSPSNEKIIPMKPTKSTFKASDNLEYEIDTLFINDLTIQSALLNGDFTEFSFELTGTRNESITLDAKLKEKLTDDKIIVELSSPKGSAPAGLFDLTFQYKDESAFISETEVSWGVIAINPDQSVYKSQSIAKIDMAVLDKRGRMVCDADLVLIIEAPDGSTTNLSTDAGSIEITEGCFTQVTDLPDYTTTYQAGGEGTYKMQFIAETSEGIFNIEDEFKVDDNSPFYVRRVGPTRIFPLVYNDMHLEITSNYDTGSYFVVERVPRNFKFSVEQTGQIEEMGVEKTITWEEELVKGQTKTISYSFDAPVISPTIFLLGPLEIKCQMANDECQMSSWNEGRKWQIASDIQTARPTSDISAGSWTDEGAVDNDGSLYTSVDETSQDGDTSRVEGASGAGTFEVKLGSVTDPVSSTGHTVILWGKGVGSGGGEKVDVYLYESTTLRATVKNNWTPGRSAYASTSYTLSAGEADAISSYSDLRVRVVEDTIGGGSERFNVTQIYMEFPDASADTYDQNAFRIRSDDSLGLNVNSGWEEDLNIDASIYPDTEFRIRFEIEQSGGTASEGFQLWYSREGGSYAIVPTSNGPTNFHNMPNSDGGQKTVQAIVSAQYADLENTSDILSASADAFIAGDGNEDNEAPAVSFTDPSHTEQEWTILIRKTYELQGHNPDGTTFAFRLRKSDGSVLDTYTNTPTITVKNWPGHIGGTTIESPMRYHVVDGNGNLYYLGEYADIQASNSNSPVMMKSTDGGDSWNPQDVAGASTEVDLEGGDMDLRVNAISIVLQGPGGSEMVSHHVFNVSTHGTNPDEWAVIDEQIDFEPVPSYQCAAIATRSATTVAAYCGDIVSTDDRLNYRIKDGTWGSELEVDSNTGVDWTGVGMVRDSTDKIHFVYSGNDGTNHLIYMNTLSTVDSLGARQQLYTEVEAPVSNDRYDLTPPFVWDDGGTERVGVAYIKPADQKLYFRSWNASTEALDAEQGISDSAVEENEGGSHQPTADVRADDDTDVLHAIFSEKSALDIWYDKRVSGSWGTDTEQQDAVGAAWIRSLIFTHSGANGGNKVLGYIWDDSVNAIDSAGGTGFTRYDEIVISTGSPTTDQLMRHGNWFSGGTEQGFFWAD